MRYLILVGLLLVFVPFISAQSDVKIKLRNGQTIEGEWLGIENDHFLIGQGESIIRYIPEGMVLKLKVVPDINSYPGYDKNRNMLIWGLSGAFNSTLGQKEKNLQGLGGKISVGYDWEHNYALYVSAGYSNMNIGEPETFFPVSILPVKYLTEGRLLVFAGLEAGMNFGISNPWESAISRRSMNIDRHISWSQPTHFAGKGISLTPTTGIRIIGKYGIDHVISLGLHLQQFTSQNKFKDDFYSKIDLLYRRWQINYGLIF